MSARGENKMKFAKALGLSILFFTVSLVLAQTGGVGIPKKEDVPKYMRQLQSSPSAADRAKAAEMLGKRGRVNANDVEDAIDPLKKALQKDKDAKVRAAAARALGDIHPEDTATVSLLVDRLKNDEVMDVKMATVVALGQFGADAKEALPPLREMFAKYDTKAAKKSADAQTIQAAIKSISGAKGKKN
jgi:HEAT repeat protein